MSAHNDLENFWANLEEKLHVQIPSYIKKLFIYEGIDRPEIFKDCNDDIDEILEGTARTELYRRNISPDESLEHYYGEFHQSPKNFKFSFSDRRIIIKIITAVKLLPLSVWGSTQEETETTESTVTALQRVWCCFKRAFDGSSESTFLCMLISSALENINKKPKGKSYTNEIFKKICCYIYILGGPILYQTLAANLPLPSLSAVKSYVTKEKVPLVEGFLRSNELTTFFEKRGYQKMVWISEDATRIKKKFNTIQIAIC